MHLFIVAALIITACVRAACISGSVTSPSDFTTLDQDTANTGCPGGTPLLRYSAGAFKALFPCNSGEVRVCNDTRMIGQNLRLLLDVPMFRTLRRSGLAVDHDDEVFWTFSTQNGEAAERGSVNADSDMYMLGTGGNRNDEAEHRWLCLYH